MLSKRPIQVYLLRRQDRALRRIARERGESLSAMIRASVDLMLREMPVETDPAWGIVNLGQSDSDDLGRAHDDHLAEELAAETRR